MRAKRFHSPWKIFRDKKSGNLDFAVIFSERIADAAAVYTSNKVKGAPLIVTKKHLENGKAQAIAINSGRMHKIPEIKDVQNTNECHIGGFEIDENNQLVVVAVLSIIFLRALQGRQSRI